MKKELLCIAVFAGVCMVAFAQQDAKKDKVEAIAIKQKADAKAPASPQAGAQPATKGAGGSTGATQKNINTSEDNLGSGKGGKIAPSGSSAPADGSVKPASEHGSGLASGK